MNATYIQNLSILIYIPVGLIPLIMVLRGDWPVSAALIFYWIEIIIVGLFNVVKLATVCLFGTPFASRYWSISRGQNILISFLLLAFFTVKFGLFALFMGILFAIIPDVLTSAGGAVNMDIGDVFARIAEVAPALKTSVPLLVVGQAFYFAGYFILNKAYKTARGFPLVFKPYARVFGLFILVMLALIIALLWPVSVRPVMFVLTVGCIKILIDMLVVYAAERPRRTPAVRNRGRPDNKETA